MEFRVDEIAAICAGEIRERASSRRVATQITWDSRDVEPSALYVALPGARVDGHDFIEAALGAGASAVLMSRNPTDSQRVAARNADAALIQVPDCAVAIAELAKEWRRRLRALVIGVTGSSGKTTTKNLTYAVLSSRWRVHATAGNQNNELGVPKTILDTPEDCQILIIELGVDAPGDMAWLTDVTKPDWGIIVSVGSSHLEFLRDERTVAWEKSGLWRALPQSGRAFLNIDDAWASECYRFGALDRGIAFDVFGHEPKPDAALSMIAPTRARSLKVADVGILATELLSKAHHQVLADAVSTDEWGRPRFDLVYGTGSRRSSHPVTLQLVGGHNVADACAAAAVGFANGLDGATIAEALSACEPEPGRAEIIEAASGATIVNDSYNANPLSMRATLESFSHVGGARRRFVVVGDMGELGEAAESAHRSIGDVVAALGFDGAVFVGELSSLGAERAREAGMDASAVWEAAGAAVAGELMASRLQAGDAVLVKGSRFMGLERVVEDLV